MLDNDTEKAKLAHVGILGMKWGHRKAQDSGGSSSGSKRRFDPKSLTKNMDGRKVNKLFGKRNRTKVRNFFLGDANEAVKRVPILKSKYAKASKEEKARIKEKTSTALAVISVVSLAAMGAMIGSTFK